MAESEILAVLCTFPDTETARQIGTKLVESQLAACVNLLPGVESIYRWQGQVETATEVLALIKTTRAAFDPLQSTLTALHPYDVPEILALHPAHVSPAYAAWLRDSVTPTPDTHPDGQPTAP